MRRAEVVERFSCVGAIGDFAENLGGVRRRLRQFDIVAHARVRKTPGLQVPREGEHGLGKLELGFRQRIRAQPGKVRDLVVRGLEAVSIGALEPCDDGLGARILDALVEPQRKEIAVLVERLDRNTFPLAVENLVAFGEEQVADFFRNGAVRGIKAGQRVGCGGLLGRNSRSRCRGRWCGCRRLRLARHILGGCRWLAWRCDHRSQRIGDLPRRHCRGA